MIEIELHDDQDHEIARVNMHHAPAVGDVLWLLPHREKSSYKVKQVCHWVSDAPGLAHLGYHRVCVYVEAV